MILFHSLFQCNALRYSIYPARLFISLHLLIFFFLPNAPNILTFLIYLYLQLSLCALLLLPSLFKCSLKIHWSSQPSPICSSEVSRCLYSTDYCSPNLLLLLGQPFYPRPLMLIVSTFYSLSLFSPRPPLHIPSVESMYSESTAWFISLSLLRPWLAHPPLRCYLPLHSTSLHSLSIFLSRYDSHLYFLQCHQELGHQGP